MIKVSIIIPTYNCAKYLPQAIESVLNQTFKDFEIIIIDDGSVDDTAKILKQFVNGDKIRAYFQKNMGPAAARNRGIKESRGNYIAFLDADDLWLDNYLEQCVKYLEEQYFDLVMTDNYADFYSEDNKFLRRESRKRENYLDNKDRLYEVLFQRFQNGFTGEIRIVIKKSCFDRIEYFDEKIRIAEDWDLWLRIAKSKLKIGYIEMPLFIYRRHPNATCRRKENKKSMLTNVYYAFKKNKDDAFKINSSLKKIYGKTLWLLGSESIAEKIDIFWGIKRMLESQIYYLDFKQLLKLTKKYLFRF